VLLLVALLQAEVPIGGWVNPADASAAAVRTSAERLRATADAVVASRRAGHFAELHTDAADLVRRAKALEAQVRTDP
jgi:hypothetical protein